VATTRLRAETQILKWYKAGEDRYLLVLRIHGTPSPQRQFFKLDQIDSLAGIPEREVKTAKEGRKIWGCPPFPVPSRWERLLEDDDEVG
jgi:hypothetical protein